MQQAGLRPTTDRLLHNGNAPREVANGGIHAHLCQFTQQAVSWSRCLQPVLLILSHMDPCISGGRMRIRIREQIKHQSQQPDPDQISGVVEGQKWSHDGPLRSHGGSPWSHGGSLWSQGGSPWSHDGSLWRSEDSQMKPWRCALCRPMVVQILITLMMSRILICISVKRSIQMPIEVKRRIRIHIKLKKPDRDRICMNVMRISNTAYRTTCRTGTDVAQIEW
jgi:hypothetical protein